MMQSYAKELNNIDKKEKDPNQSRKGSYCCLKKVLFNEFCS